MQSLHDMQSGKAVVAAAVTTAYMHMMRFRLSCVTSLRKKKYAHPPTRAYTTQRGDWCKLTGNCGSVGTALKARMVSQRA